MGYLTSLDGLWSRRRRARRRIEHAGGVPAFTVDDAEVVVRRPAWSMYGPGDGGRETVAAVRGLEHVLSHGERLTVVVQAEVEDTDRHRRWLVDNVVRRAVSSDPTAVEEFDSLVARRTDELLRQMWTPIHMTVDGADQVFEKLDLDSDTAVAMASVSGLTISVMSNGRWPASMRLRRVEAGG